MKYIKPPDFKSVKEFEAHYKKIEEQITTLLTTDGSAKTSKELNALLNTALNSAVAYLSKKNNTFTKSELPTAFKEGKESVQEPVKVTAKETTAILEKKGFKYAGNAFSYNTYVELQTALNDATNGLKKRVNKVIEDLRKQGKDTVYEVQQAIIKDFEQRGVLVVKYANGAKQPLHAYAAMAARSARIESINIGAIGKAIQAGTDYVKMTTVPQCCLLCGAYQGKVYSISGKDKRFPALFKTVLKNGYALPHPNCRHEFIPWFPEMEDPVDVDRMIKRSKIKYDKQGNLLDVRFQKDIKGYAEWQAGNRQRNTELLEFERMKKHYAGREEEMPYTTLAGFRRARRAQAESYKDIKNKLADASKYGDKLPKPKGYNQELIKSANYEQKFTQIVDNSIKHSVAVAAREILRENNRVNEETAIAFNAFGERILKQKSNGLFISVDMTEINKQPKDSVVLIHNHPQNDSFSDRDLRFMQNEQIHSIIAVCPNGKIFSLRTNCGKRVDEYIVSEYNRYMSKGVSREEVLRDMANRYTWEYKEL